MISEESVKEAVEFFKDETKRGKEFWDEAEKHSQIVLSIAELWLSRKTPKKKTLNDYLLGEIHSTEEMQGWNAAIDAMRLASAVSEEEIKKIISNWVNNRLVSYHVIDERDEDNLAHALATAFTAPAKRMSKESILNIILKTQSEILIAHGVVATNDDLASAMAAYVKGGEI